MCVCACVVPCRRVAQAVGFAPTPTPQHTLHTRVTPATHFTDEHTARGGWAGSSTAEARWGAATADWFKHPRKQACGRGLMQYRHPWIAKAEFGEVCVMIELCLMIDEWKCNKLPTPGQFYKFLGGSPTQTTSRRRRQARWQRPIAARCRRQRRQRTPRLLRLPPWRGRRSPQAVVVGGCGGRCNACMHTMMTRWESTQQQAGTRTGGTGTHAPSPRWAAGEHRRE